MNGSTATPGTKRYWVGPIRPSSCRRNTKADVASLLTAKRGVTLGFFKVIHERDDRFGILTIRQKKIEVGSTADIVRLNTQNQLMPYR